MGCDQVAVSLGEHFFLATGCRMRSEERAFLLEKLKQVGIGGSITFRHFSHVTSEPSSKRAVSLWSWYYAFVDMLRRNSVSVGVALASPAFSVQLPRAFIHPSSTIAIFILACSSLVQPLFPRSNLFLRLPLPFPIQCTTASHTGLSATLPGRGHCRFHCKNNRY